MNILLMCYDFDGPIAYISIFRNSPIVLKTSTTTSWSSLITLSATWCRSESFCPLIFLQFFLYKPRLREQIDKIFNLRRTHKIKHAIGTSIHKTFSLFVSVFSTLVSVSFFSATSLFLPPHPRYFMCARLTVPGNRSIPPSIFPSPNFRWETLYCRAMSLVIGKERAVSHSCLVASAIDLPEELEEQLEVRNWRCSK